MNKTPIKLGPLALLLTVVCMCLVTLSVLTFSTARADDVMSRRYEETAKIRQELEAKGQQFLFEADETLAEGGTLSRTSVVYEKDGYSLTIKLEQTGGIYIVDTWKLEKEWEEADQVQDLWPGI